MAENRLDIILAAKTDQFTSALNKVRTETKSAAAGMSRALESAGDGASVIEQALRDVDGAFGRSEEEGKTALQALADASTKAGRDLRDAFVSGGKSLEDADKEAREFVASISKFASAKKDAEALTKEFGELEEQLKEVDSAADAINFQTALDSAGDLKDGLTEITGTFTEVASQSRAMERAINLALRDPDAAAALIQSARDLKDEFGELVSEEDIGQAVKRLDTLGIATEENLNRISRASLDAGKDLEDAADTIGELLAPLDTGVFDPGAFETLRANYGIGALALKEFGAEVDSSNRILAETRSQQLAAQNALKRYLDEHDRYADVATRNKDAQALMTDEIERFQRSVGAQVNELKNLIAEALLPLAKRLNELPEGAKLAAAGFTVLIGPITTLALVGAKVVGILKALGVAGFGAAAGTEAAAASTATLGSRLTKAAAAARTFATGIGGTVLALGGLAVAAYKTAAASSDWVESLEDLDKAQSALMKTQDEAIRQNREILDLRKRSVESIREEAQAIEEFADQRKLATLTLIEAREALDAAIRDGSEAEIDAAKQRVAEAQSFRNEVDSFHAIEMRQAEERKKAKEAEFAAASEAYRNFKTEYDRGTFQSQEQALNSLKSIASGLSGDAAKEAAAQIREISQGILSDKLDALREQVAAEKVTAEQAKAIQAQLLTQYQANLDVKREAEEELSDVLAAQLEQRLQRERAYQQAALDLQKSAIQQRAQLAQDSPEIDALERRLGKGEDVIDLIKREEAAQTAKLKGYVEEEAVLDRIALKRQEAAAIQADPANAATIAEQSAERLRQLNERVNAEKAKLDRDLANKQADLEEKRAKMQEDAARKAKTHEAELAEVVRQRYELEQSQAQEVFEARRKALDEEEARGANVGQQRLDLEAELLEFTREAAKEKLKLAVDEIKARTAAANVGATPAEQALNNERAKLAILKEQQTARQTLNDLEDAAVAKAQTELDVLKQKLEVLKDQTAEKQKQAGFTLETDFGASDSATKFGSGFGVARQPKDATGPTEQELEREIKRKEIEVIKARESARKTEQSSSASRPVPTTTGTRSPGQSAAERYRQGEQQSAAERYKQDGQQSAAAQAQADTTGPQIVNVLTQILNAVNTGNQNTARLAQGHRQQAQQPKNWAEQWSKGIGDTLIS